jgi:predicted nucleic acid-binding protein
MIADTTFASDLLRERTRNVYGPASELLGRQRVSQIRLTVVTAGEIAVLFENWVQAWSWLTGWKIYRLHEGVIAAASDVDRELIRTGNRLGENDNWIAGFARYYREPLISRDHGFDRVPGLRRVIY